MNIKDIILSNKTTEEDARNFIKYMNINLDKELFTINDLIYGMNVELEHGLISPETNVTNNNLVLTGKITLAHLREFPDYYVRLKKLEHDADIYWSNKKNKNKSKKFKLIFK